MDISFFIDIHDKDGDSFWDGIFLQIDTNTIVKVDTLSDIDAMIKQLQTISKEIKENYPNQK